ncbi:MAG: hypothetical protein M1565_00795 [Actinobacteria bacterium]|nr:hypothetical protein [Actinomycetota bacterium]
MPVPLCLTILDIDATAMPPSTSTSVTPAIAACVPAVMPLVGCARYSGERCCGKGIGEVRAGSHERRTVKGTSLDLDDACGYGIRRLVAVITLDALDVRVA